MQLNFLAAANGESLTKTITPQGSRDYPKAYHFNSFEYQIPDPHPQNTDCISTIYKLARKHAEASHGMLKGILTRPLQNEPRAKTTRPDEPTQWLWLDIDGLNDVSTVDSFIAQVLPPEFHGVDHIIHYSASSGIKPGLRAHILFLLTQTMPPAIIKEWLTHLNLTNATLNKEIKLTASAIALLYPLDITTCQNDKLLYISSPRLQDIDDPFAERSRIDLCIRDQRTVDLNINNIHPAVIDELKTEKINTLRKQMKLRGVTLKTKITKSTEYAVNPARARVTSTMDDGAYIRLNLNGGDSFAYWHYKKNPLYLYNFKGEPIYRIQDIVPEYWADIQETEVINQTEDATQPVPIVFRDFNSDAYYNGIFDPSKNTLNIAPVASKDRMQDFLAQYGLQMPDPVEDWTYAFDPTTTTLIDPKKRFCNKYLPTPYMISAERVSEINLSGQCPYINRLLDSVTADPKSKSYFLNWLAYIYQKRKRPGTAWVFHGVQGTGKGLLFHNVLAPTLGRDHCKIINVEDFGDSFNEWMEHCLLLFVDEVKMNTRTRHLLNQIKSMVTEPYGRIRAMRKNAYQVPLHFGMIFASNELDAMALDVTDRRFFVADRQETPINITQKDLDGINEELQTFVNVMMSIEIDEQKVRAPYMSEAKQQMRLAGQNSNEQFFEMLREGNLDHFMILTAHEPPFDQAAEYQQCRKVLDRWLRTSQNDEECLAKLDEIRAVYEYLQSDGRHMSPSKFGRMLAHNNITTSRYADGEDHFTAFAVTFDHTEDAVMIYRSNRKVVPIKASVQRGLPE